MPADSFKHKGQRLQLVETIKRKGIKDENVLRAIGKIPRHFFIENYLQHVAYEDRALPIASGQTISQPYTVAFQTELLAVKPGNKILEVGTGSGYQTAVLLEMEAKVFSIERQHELYLKTKKHLASMRYRPTLFYDDGYKGKPGYGPFDGILITAAAPYVPRQLLEQLKIGGRLVVPVGENTQVMTLIERMTETDFKKSEHGYFAFVPMLKGTNK